VFCALFSLVPSEGGGGKGLFLRFEIMRRRGDINHRANGAWLYRGFFYFFVKTQIRLLKIYYFFINSFLLSRLFFVVTEDVSLLLFVIVGQLIFIEGPLHL
jgi:hypothetical protein